MYAYGKRPQLVFHVSVHSFVCEKWEREREWISEPSTWITDVNNSRVKFYFIPSRSNRNNTNNNNNSSRQMPSIHGRGKKICKRNRCIEAVHTFLRSTNVGDSSLFGQTTTCTIQNDEEEEVEKKNATYKHTLTEIFYGWAWNECVSASATIRTKYRTKTLLTYTEYYMNIFLLFYLFPFFDVSVVYDMCVYVRFEPKRRMSDKHTISCACWQHFSFNINEFFECIDFFPLRFISCECVSLSI